jgi:DNA-binding transcriptional regulator YdaS (Cro superfamily)
VEKNTAQTRTLRRAAAIVGGEEKLARLLGCELAQLQLWASGEAPTPSPVYLRALDIVSHGPS